MEQSQADSDNDFDFSLLVPQRSGKDSFRD